MATGHGTISPESEIKSIRIELENPIKRVSWVNYILLIKKMSIDDTEIDDDWNKIKTQQRKIDISKTCMPLSDDSIHLSVLKFIFHTI